MNFPHVLALSPMPNESPNTVLLLIGEEFHCIFAAEVPKCSLINFGDRVPPQCISNITRVISLVHTNKSSCRTFGREDQFTMICTVFS